MSITLCRTCSARHARFAASYFNAARSRRTSVSSGKSASAPAHSPRNWSYAAFAPDASPTATRARARPMSAAGWSVAAGPSGGWSTSLFEVGHCGGGVAREQLRLRPRQRDVTPTGLEPLHRPHLIECCLRILTGQGQRGLYEGARQRQEGRPRLVGTHLIEKRSCMSTLANFGVEDRKAIDQGGWRQQALRLGSQATCALGAAQAPLRECQLNQDPAARVRPGFADHLRELVLKVAGIGEPALPNGAVERRLHDLHDPPAAGGDQQLFFLRRIPLDAGDVHAHRVREGNGRKLRDRLVGRALRFGEAIGACSAKAMLPCVRVLLGWSRFACA